MSAPRKITISDTELLFQLEQGRSHAEIAAPFGCTPEAVGSRLRALRENLPAPAARRADDTVRETLDAIGELRLNYTTLGQLRDACVALLRSEDGERLDVGPHDYDLEVLVSRGGAPPVRKPLRDLLGQTDDFLISVEGKAADPRTLLLSTLGQIRQHIELAARLTERIYNAQAMQEFQREVIQAIEDADPETAARIRGRLRDRRKLRLSLDPP